MIPNPSLQFGAKYAVRIVDCRTHPDTEVSTARALAGEIRKAQASGHHAVILESDHAAATLAIDDLSRRGAARQRYLVYQPPARISGKGLTRLAHRAWREPTNPNHWRILGGGLWFRLRHSFSSSVQPGKTQGQDASVYLAEQHKARQLSNHVISQAQLAAQNGFLDSPAATAPPQAYILAEDLEYALTHAARHGAAWGAKDAVLEIHDGPLFRFRIG